MSKDHWYIDRSQLTNSPSRKHGISEEKEEACLRRTANLIQEMGRKLKLPLICINTAVLFTQRFFAYHPLPLFEKFALGASALFLAAKVEEHPRNVEHVCQVAKVLGIVRKGMKDAEYAQEIIVNENLLLQTLGFEVLVQHPHQHVLRLCNLLQAAKPLSQTSYILATYCLHLTRMCLIYKPVNIACLCIHVACKLKNFEIPLSREGKSWYTYGDPDMTEEMLEKMSDEFTDVCKQCPDNIKNKTINLSHESLEKKVVLDDTGLPLVIEGCHDYKSDAPSTPTVSHEPIPSTTALEPKSSTVALPPKHATVTLNFKHSPTSQSNPLTVSEQLKPSIISQQQKPLVIPEKKYSTHSHSNPVKKEVPSSSNYSNSLACTPSNKSAFTSSSNKTDCNNGLINHKMYNGHNLSHSSSLHRKQPEQVVPPIKLTINKFAQQSNNISHASINGNKHIHSLKVTIPKSRFMTPTHSPVAERDVKTDTMSLTFNSTLMTDMFGHNPSKKFKPN